MSVMKPVAESPTPAKRAAVARKALGGVGQEAGMLAGKDQEKDWQHR